MKLLRAFFILLIIAFILAVMVIAGGLIWLQNTNHQQFLSNAIEQQAGWKTRFGDVSLSVFPKIKLQAQDIAVLPHQGDVNVLTAQSLQVEAGILPLLLDRKIETINIAELDVKLIRDSAGKANWEPVRQTRRQAAQGASFDPAVLTQFGTVNITNGKLRLTDAETGQNVQVNDFSVTLDEASQNIKRGRIAAQINAVPLQAQIRLRLDEGANVPTDFTLNFAENSASFEGMLANANSRSPKLIGDVGLDAPTLLYQLNQLQLTDLPAAAERLPLALNSQLELSQKEILTSKLDITLGQNTLSGQVNAQPQAQQYAVELTTEALNLNFLPACMAADTQPGQGSTQASSTAQPATPWSNQLIDTTPLQALSLNLQLNLRNVSCGENAADQILVQSQLVNGNLNLERLVLELADAAGRLSINGTTRLANNVSGDLTFQAENFHPTMFVSALKNRFDVPLQINSQLAFSGKTQQELVASLNGSLRANADEGKVVGLSVGNFVKTLEQLARGQVEATEVQNLQLFNADYTIENGVLRTEAFELATRNMEVTGEGKVDLANWTINKTFTPSSPAVNLPPVQVRGSLNKPQVVPQISAEVVSTAAGALLGGPAGAAVGNLVGGLLSGDTANSDAAEGAAPENPIVDLLDRQNLENNLRNFLSGGE